MSTLNKETQAQVKELNAQIKAIKADRDAFENEQRRIYRKYSDMEGMYGKQVSDPWQGMGFRGYYFEYPNKETKAKENREREEFLKNSGYLDTKERNQYIDKHFNKVIDELEERKCELQHDCTLEQWNTQLTVRAYKRYVTESKEEILRLQEKIKEYEKFIEENEMQEV